MVAHSLDSKTNSDEKKRPMRERILVCDDEELIRWSLSEHLGKEGYDVVTASDGEECVAMLAKVTPDAVLLDLKMPKMDGMQVLQHIRKDDPDLPVIVITAHGGVESAIEATRLGAAAYLAKPFDLREVSLKLERTLEDNRLAREVRYLRQERRGYERLVGQSRAMEKVFETLSRLEQVDSPTVLITGESGTGKDLVAQAIHARGPRQDQPFMEIDCTALPEHLIESELFGHEKGSFTDAKATKRGLFEMAKGGVIFLDEIGEMPVSLQAKLLRAIENRKFKRVGGVIDIPLEAAIIAATNRDLEAHVKAGRFREDLFFRLNVIPVEIPPLRQRASDIELLINHLLEKLRKENGHQVQGVAADALQALERYPWPGNVRELRNVVERIVILNRDAEVIRLDHLPSEVRGARLGKGTDGCPFELPEEGIDFEAVVVGLIQQALDRTGGNQSAAARLLGISRYMLRYRMEKYGMKG
jgi:two-component system response regulator AtoC